MVETALSILVAVFVMFWMWELIMALYTYSVLSDAAKEGVRYAIVHGKDNSSCDGPSAGCDSTAANTVAKVNEYAAYSLHDISAINVGVSYPDRSSAPGSRVSVTINYSYVPYITLPWTAPNLRTGATGRIVY
jgi:TadE-like protein